MRRVIGVLLVLGAVAAATAAPAAEARSNGVAGCGEQRLEQPFVQFLDPLTYVLVPNGGLESGATGWTLSGGARVVSGNEPYAVSGPGASSLYLPKGSSAVPPPTCVGLLDPTLRFFVRKDSPLSLASLEVEILFTGLLGLPTSLELLPGVTGTSAWLPTLPQVTLGSVLPATSLDGLTATVRFRFTPRSVLFSSSSFRIDDVYVDPFKLL